MIALRPMDEAGFQAYLAYAVDVYAKEKVKAGNWTPEESLVLSKKSFDDSLPQGLATPGHYLFTLVSDRGESVGILWYGIDAVKPTSAFVYDFEIHAPFQRQGHATAALKALDDHARAQGVRRLGLHVFAANAPARGLYLKAGFHDTNVQMAKDL